MEEGVLEGNALSIVFPAQKHWLEGGALIFLAPGSNFPCYAPVLDTDIASIFILQCAWIQESHLK